MHQNQFVFNFSCDLFFCFCFLAGGESIKEINRRSGAHVEIDKSQRGQQSDGSDKMFVIRGTNEQIQYAQQLIYERITGVRLLLFLFL